MCVYVGCKLFDQVLLKTMKHCLFIIFHFIGFFLIPSYFSCVAILMVKELSHIFSSTTFDHTFGRHQG